MRAVLQRVKGATVHVDGKGIVSRIGPGIVALIGIGADDTAEEIEPLAKKLLGTKLWNEGQLASSIAVPVQYRQAGEVEEVAVESNEKQTPTSAATATATEGGTSRAHEVWNGRPWRTNVMELGGEVLCVSQFTLHARLSKGTKPDFHKSMSGQQAKEIYDAFLARLGDMYKQERIKDGAFGEMMDVSLTNDGPVTILIDTNEKK